MNVTKSLALGIVAAAIPTCVGVPQAAAAVVHTQSNLLAPASPTLFVTMTVDADLHRPPRVLLSWGSTSLPAGPSSLDIDLGGVVPDFHGYTLIGLDANGGVMVTFADPAAAAGREFSSVFRGYNESEVAASILAGGPLLNQFINNLETIPGLATRMGVESRAMRFSVGADYGSFVADFNPIPSVGAASIFAFAGLGCASTRQRRRVK